MDLHVKQSLLWKVGFVAGSATQVSTFAILGFYYVSSAMGFSYISAGC